MGEFDLIERFFKTGSASNASNTTLSLGIGDDCALIKPLPGEDIAITSDMLVAGRHFFADADPEQLGHKLLAVNLSDLASMGAQPLSVTLALTLPKVNEEWLTAFSKGFLGLAEQYSVDLIGGDTTSGPLTLTVQALGLVPNGKGLRRSTAQPGDFIYMTGCLGDAGLGLKIKQGDVLLNSESALARFNHPNPQVEAGLALLDIANACIDISDGLLSDLGHILEQSQVGASLDWELLPLSEAVKSYINETGDWALPLIAGDDYELCFTVSPEKVKLLTIPCTKIGVIEAIPGLRLYKSGQLQSLTSKGYEHFS